MPFKRKRKIAEVSNDITELDSEDEDEDYVPS